MDRSYRPHHSRRATRADVVEKIVWLRKHYSHHASIADRDAGEYENGQRRARRRRRRSRGAVMVRQAAEPAATSVAGVRRSAASG